MKQCATVILLFLGLAVSIFAQSTNKWDKEIAPFIASDRTNPPPQDAVLFIGSSSIRLWKSLREDFPDVKTVNRGFGGSQIADATHYVDRIVWPYKPKTIVFYSGDNDLAASLKPEEVFADWKKFVARVRERLPQTPIIFIAIKPSPKRWNIVEQQRKANALIKGYCETEKNLVFIDIFTPMLTPDGQPRAELFVADQLHLNDKGYKLWQGLVAPAVAAAQRKGNTGKSAE